MNKRPFKGRGAQVNPANRFQQQSVDNENFDDYREDEEAGRIQTKFYKEHPKKVVNKVSSPDVGMMHSLNPYQGCEHGCVYCYARNSHEYWGFSAGKDFESRIIIKENAPDLLRQYFEKRGYRPHPITLSGNTDCYQPAERRLELTRNLLKVFAEYRNPLGIITKNALVERDIDILSELAEQNLAWVVLSVTTMDEDLRRRLEPRTATIKSRLRAIENLRKNNIPVSVNIAPIIPGLTDHEVPQIMKAVAAHGAVGAGYTVVRLNGAIGEIFENWVRDQFPDRADKILNQVASCHGGNLNDSRWGTRIKGEGNFARIIKQVFEVSKRKYFPEKFPFEYNLKAFRKPGNGQLDLFG